MKKLSLFLSLLITFVACSKTEKPTNTPALNTERLIEDIQFISSDMTQGRLVGTEGNRYAREYIVGRFNEIGIEPYGDDYEHPFEFTRRNGDKRTGVNVIGIDQGTSDSVIVITAHYDHLGIRDSLIYNGADDNASGTAGLIAIMDYFSKTEQNHTLIFAALDGEEGGLRGARALVQDSVLMDKVVLNINMDMIAQNDKNELYAVGTYHYPQLKPVLENVITGDVSLLFGQRENFPQDLIQYIRSQSFSLPRQSFCPTGRLQLIQF